MYRVAKKTTKRTQGHCLKCKHHKEICKVSGVGTLVECIAPNKCMMTSFNANDFYCVEYKGYNEMTQSEKDALAKKIWQEKSLKDYREYVKSYPKKFRAQMIKEYKEKLYRG